MAFFANDAVNRVNLHAVVQALAQGGGQLFLFVLLLRAGLSPPQALLAQAGIVAGRFVLRPALLPFAVRLGLKPLMITGALAVAAEYPLLAEVRGLGAPLVALIATAAAAETLYYVASNAYFAAVGDAEHRGHQIGVRQVGVALAGVLGPLAGAAALVGVGSHPTLWAVAAVQALSVLPLVGAPNVAVAARASGVVRYAAGAVLLIALDGWFDTVWLYVWEIALYLALDQSVAAYGGAMALAGLAGGVTALWLGRRIDLKGARGAVIGGYGAVGIVALARALSLDAPWLAVAANAAGAFVMPLIIPPLVKATHNRAQAGPCAFRFMVATEGGWDVGCFLCCLAAAALLSGGTPLGWTLLLALPAIAGAAAVLLRLQPPGGG